MLPEGGCKTCTPANPPVTIPHRRLVRSTTRSPPSTHPASKTGRDKAVGSAPSGAVKNTMSERNPVSIESGKRKRSTAKASTRNTAGKSGKDPVPAKHSGRSRGMAAKSSATTATSTRSASGRKTTAGKKVEAAPKRASNNESTAQATDTVRTPENRHSGLHERSYAAHLDAGPKGPHTKPAGDLRFLAPFPTGRKQP